MTMAMKKKREFISSFQENVTVSDISDNSDHLSLEEGEISESPELKKETFDIASYESPIEEEIQWSGLQILMAGDERVIDYNWKYLKMYPNQHFIHLANANLRSLCLYIDKQINENFDIILVFAFHYDFAYMQYDEKYGFDDLLLDIRPEVQFEELIKTVREFHDRWEKLSLCRKIVWILPSAINFYKYNLSLIKHSKTLTAKSLNKDQYHDMSKKYFEYSQKLCEHWRKSLKTIPFLPLNDILFSKKYKYQDSFAIEGPPKFPEGFQVDGLKPTALMTAYLAYYLIKLMHDERDFPLIRSLPKLKDTEARVVEKDSLLEKYIHEYSKKRKSTSHHRSHKRSRKRKKHYSESSEDEGSPSFSTHSTIDKRQHRKKSHSGTRHRHKDNSSSHSSSQTSLNKRKYSKSSTKSRSSSRSRSRSRNTDCSSLPGEKSFIMDMSDTVRSVSEEVEFYRKLACLREVHDIQCNSYRCHSTSHPSYNEEKTKFFSRMQDSGNYNHSKAEADWDNYWKDKLEELFKVDWETKKKLLLLKLQSKITEKRNEPKGFSEMLEEDMFLNKERCVKPVSFIPMDAKVEQKKFDNDKPTAASLIDLTETSPLKKDKQKINIKDYIRMQKIHHDIELKEEIQQFILTSKNRSGESVNSDIRPLINDSSIKSFTPKSSISFNSNNSTDNPKSPNFTPSRPNQVFTPRSPTFTPNSPTFTEISPTYAPNSSNITPNCSTSFTKCIDRSNTLKSPDNNNLKQMELGKDHISGKQISSSSTDSILTSSLKKEKPKIKVEDYLRMQKVHQGNESNNFELDNFGKSLNCAAKPPSENLHIAAKTSFTQNPALTPSYIRKSSLSLNSPTITPISASKSSTFTPRNVAECSSFTPTCSTSTPKTTTHSSKSVITTVKSPILKSSPDSPTSPISPNMSINSSPNDNKLNSSDSECFPNDSDSDLDIDQLMGNADFLEGLKEIDEELRKAEYPEKSSCSSTKKNLTQKIEICPVVNSLPPEKQIPKAIVPPKIINLPKAHLPKAIVSPNCSFPTREIFLPHAALKEKVLPKATISPLRQKLSESLSFQDSSEKVTLKDRELDRKSEIGLDYVNVLKMLFRLSRHLGSLGLSITALYNAAMADPMSCEDIPDDDAKTILTLVNRKINSLLNQDLSQVQRAIFEEVSGKLKKLLDNLNMQNDKFNNINIHNIASATVGQTVSQIISFIKNTLLYHGYADFESKDVMNLYMSVKAAHSNMGSCS